MLIIDVRENNLIREAEKLNIDFETAKLPVGDITNDKGSFVVERKSFNDFWSSMKDRRLYAQLRELSECKCKSYLFTEFGVLEDLVEFKGKKALNWIYSLFGEAENYGVNFREYSTDEDLLRKLVSLDKKLGTEHNHHFRNYKVYHQPVAMKLLMSCDGVGEKLAKEMLKICGSFKGVIKDLFGDQKKLDTIKGLKKGGKILTNMKAELSKKYE